MTAWPTMLALSFKDMMNDSLNDVEGNEVKDLPQNSLAAQAKKIQR
jgi:hypothetical protein